MSRVQLALNVADLEASVRFYSRLLQVEPHKRRPGYANFQVEQPPLKLVLIETTQEARGSGTVGALNHLGVEVDSTAQVQHAHSRLKAAGMAVTEEAGTECCYAQQDKVWVHDPAGTPWEVYAITDDNPPVADSNGSSGCACGTAPSAGQGLPATTGSFCC